MSQLYLLVERSNGPESMFFPEQKGEVEGECEKSQGKKEQRRMLDGCGEVRSRFHGVIWLTMSIFSGQSLLDTWNNSGLMSGIHLHVFSLRSDPVSFACEKSVGWIE